jgi:predicted amidophosphoribosyltransferase
LYARPESLEDFDKIADEVLGISTNKTKKTFAQNQSSDSKTCPSCSCKIKTNANFCPHCGKPQSKAMFCKICGHKFDTNENFCSECGTKRE